MVEETFYSNKLKVSNKFTWLLWYLTNYEMIGVLPQGLRLGNAWSKVWIPKSGLHSLIKVMENWTQLSVIHPLEHGCRWWPTVTHCRNLRNISHHPSPLVPVSNHQPLCDRTTAAGGAGPSTGVKTLLPHWRQSHTWYGRYFSGQSWVGVCMFHRLVDPCEVASDV